MEYLPKHDLHIKLNKEDGKTPFRVSDCSELTIKVFTSSRKHYLKFGFDDVEEKENFDILIAPSIMLKTLKSGVIQYNVEYQKKGNQTCWFSFTVVTDIYLKNPFYKQTEEEEENGSIVENLIEILDQYKEEMSEEIDSKLDAEIYEREKQTFLTEQSLLGYATEKSVDDLRGQLALKADKSELNNFATKIDCGLQAQQSEDNAKKYTDSKIENLVKLWNCTKDDFDNINPKDFQTLYVVDAKISTNVYLGDILLGEKEIDQVEITGHLLRGKFTDDSTSSDWWYYKNGSNTPSNKVDISEFVDPITKEFEIDLGENNNTLAYLFYNNWALERIDKVPLGDVATDCRYMFFGCSELKSVSMTEFTGKNVTSCFFMFIWCSSLQSVSMPQFTGEKVTSCNLMFNSCSELQTVSLPQFTGEKVTDCQNIFGNCSSLQSVSLPQFKGKELSICYSMFFGCSSLQSVSLPQFTGEKVTACNFMFSECSELQSVSMPQFTGEKVIECISMFSDCSSLQNIFINFAIGENTTVTSMFEDSTNYYPDFTTIQTTGGLKICNSIDFSYCRSLTNDSVMVIINALEDRTEKTNKILTVFQTQYDELTPEQLAIATSKNWTVARI